MNDTYWLKLSLLSPLSHHDPSQADKSNVLLFHRQKQWLDRASTGRLIKPEHRSDIIASLPVPIELSSFFNEIGFHAFVGTAFLRLFINIYGGTEGDGLFSGIERYKRLEERTAQSAIQSGSLFEFWGLLTNSLQVGMPPNTVDNLLISLLSIPSASASRILHHLAVDTQALIMLAREWHKLDKDKAPKAPPIFADEYEASTTFSVEVPSFSANSLRHELIREPGMWHLLNALGIDFYQLPASVAALLYNGGNLEKGAKAPNDSFALSQTIWRNYPLLKLLGGSTSGWILGDSDLSVHAWIVCKENNDALALAGVQSEVSVFDLIDQENMVHMTNRLDASPMPFSFETLAKGAQIMVRLNLSPYANPLQLGALAAAVHTYTALDSTIGGQRARGHGLINPRWHMTDAEMRDLLEAQVDYEQFLADNADSLKAGLLDGTLATGSVVCK